MKARQKEAARIYVTAQVRRSYDHACRVVRINGDGYCITYRKEIRRLWRKALRAVMA